MMRRSVTTSILLLALGFSAGAVACTPRDREAVTPLVKPATSITCILLRALTTSGTVDEVCATADELAPYVTDILARRELGDAGEDVAEASSFVAMAMPAPRRRVPRRRCVSWVSIASLGDAGRAGLEDGGTDAR